MRLLARADDRMLCCLEEEAWPRYRFIGRVAHLHLAEMVGVIRGRAEKRAGIEDRREEPGLMERLGRDARELAGGEGFGQLRQQLLRIVPRFERLAHRDAAERRLRPISFNRGAQIDDVRLADEKSGARARRARIAQQPIRHDFPTYPNGPKNGSPI